MTVEVHHAISKRLKTWAEVCECACLDLGDTPPDSKVSRLIGKPVAVSWKLQGLDKDEPFDKLTI